MNEFNLDDYKAQLITKYDQIRTNIDDISESDPDSKVFCYLVADTFERTDPDYFCYTDGPLDLGIDFYVTYEDEYRIYQCKSKVDHSAVEGRSFDTTSVNELCEAVDYLISEDREASKAIKGLKADFSLNSDEGTLVAVLAVEGHLTDSAFERFNERAAYYDALGIELKLIDESSLYAQWSTLNNLEKPRNVDLKLEIADKGLMRMNDWFCAAVTVGALLRGMSKYGYGLFNLNVRSTLKKSNVNKAIKRSVSTPQGRKQFIHLNNGLVITCNSFSYSSDCSQVTIKGAQIINGCQTVTSIWDQYNDSNSTEKAAIERELKVIVKVISNNELSKNNLLENIIVASNNQNPMTERNLHSNMGEQILLQKRMCDRNQLNKGQCYFYIRKDGELEAFSEGYRKNGMPRKCELTIPDSTRRGINRLRHIDNEELGKIWYSWIGNSSPVNSGSAKLFSKSHYPHIYTERPSESHWNLEKEPDYRFNAEDLEKALPSAFQLLLALACSKYIEATIRLDNASKLRRETVQKLKDEHRLAASASPSEEAKALAEDENYLFLTWKNNMTYPLTEVAAFILLNKYGPLTPLRSKSLIELPDVAFWLEHGTDKNFIHSPKMENGLLNSLMCYIDFVLINAFQLNKPTILLENRPKIYLGKHAFISYLKAELLRVNTAVINYPLPSKPLGLTFLDTLPEIKLQ